MSETQAKKKAAGPRAAVATAPEPPPTATAESGHRRLWQRVLASRGLQGLVVLLVFSWLAWSWAGQYGSLESVRAQFGLRAAALTVVVQAVIAVSPFPDEVIGFANCVIYGFAVGALLNWLAWMLGSFIEYGIAARSARDLDLSPERIAQRLPRRLRRFPPDHVAFLILARLLPIGGGHLVNTAAGVCRVPLGRFAWTGAIGMLPGSLTISALANGFSSWVG